MKSKIFNKFSDIAISLIFHKSTVIYSRFMKNYKKIRLFTICRFFIFSLDNQKFHKSTVIYSRFNEKNTFFTIVQIFSFSREHR